MSDIVSLVQSEVERALRARFVDKYGVVTSYHPEKHLAKVKMQPDGLETGWLRIHEPSIGNGWGIVTGLSIGDQVKLESTNGDVNNLYISGRVHSDADAPPRADSGEMVLKHQGGMTMTFSNDGKLNITGPADVTINGVVIDSSGKITAPGDVIAGTVSLQHHLTTNVTAGAALSGPPQA